MKLSFRFNQVNRVLLQLFNDFILLMLMLAAINDCHIKFWLVREKKTKLKKEEKEEEKRQKFQFARQQKIIVECGNGGDQPRVLARAVSFFSLVVVRNPLKQTKTLNHKTQQQHNSHRDCFPSSRITRWFSF